LDDGIAHTFVSAPANTRLPQWLSGIPRRAEYEGMANTIVQLICWGTSGVIAPSQPIRLGFRNWSREIPIIQCLGGAMTKTTSFQTDIRPLFTERDIQGMSKAFNLASYDDVKKHAGAIYDRIRGIGGPVMPPPPPRGEGPWQQSRIELFAKWMADGLQP
jgi:hypothetical protein